VNECGENTRYLYEIGKMRNYFRNGRRRGKGE
jgi:hypothetical protein